MNAGSSNAAPSPRHPHGLYTLFFTEMWERCSYYGMRGLLVLFLKATLEKGALEFSIPMAGLIAGESTSAKQMAHQFWWVAVAAAGIAVLLMFLARPMRRWMAGIN